MPWKERLHYAAAVAVMIGAFVRNPWRVAGFWMLWGGAVGLAAALAWALTEPLRRRSAVGRVVANILLVLSTAVPTLLMLLFGWEFPKRH